MLISPNKQCSLRFPLGRGGRIRYVLCEALVFVTLTVIARHSLEMEGKSTTFPPTTPSFKLFREDDPGNISWLDQVFKPSQLNIVWQRFKTNLEDKGGTAEETSARHRVPLNK